MKRILSTILATVGLLSAPAAFAQTAVTPFNQPFYYASAWGAYSIPDQQPNTYTFAGRTVCNQSAQGLQFFPFNTNAPVYIQDQTSSNSEVVTPSAIINTAGSCGVQVAPTHAHYTFWLRSGSGGLQEALNTLANTNTTYPALVLLDRNFYAQAAAVPGTTPAAIIAAAKGSAAVLLEDITTSPATYYSWNGSAYVATSGVTGGRAVPTAAAGAGAGTSPTIAATGNGSVVNVALTAGTTTATGTIFTLTYANSSAFTYAPTCSIQSVGANVPAGTLSVASTYASSHATVTASIATTALTASTAYQFRVTCQ